MQGIPPLDLLTHLGARYCGRHRVAGISQGYAGEVIRRPSLSSIRKF